MFGSQTSAGEDTPQAMMAMVSHMIAMKKWQERTDRLKGHYSDKDKTGTSGGSVFFRDVLQSGMPNKLYTTVPAIIKPEHLVNIFETEWKLPVPTLILQVICSASSGHKMTGHSQLVHLQDGIITAASKTEMWIITNGLNAGIAKEIGNAVNTELERRSAQTCPRHGNQSFVGLPHLTLMGTTPTSLLTYPDTFLEKKTVVRVASVGNRPNENKFELNAFHSHFLIMRDSIEDPVKSYNMMLDLANYLKASNIDEEDTNVMMGEELVDKKSSLVHGRPPMVALLVGGGYRSTQFVREHLKSQIPVVVLKGSGGAADLLAFAYKEMKEQPRGSWDPEYMETFILPELSKMIATLFKKYREDGIGRRNFREDIIRCINMSHQDDGNQVLLTFLDIDSQSCDLTKLNEHLLRGLAKGEKRETSGLSRQRYLKKDLYLTLDWNCPHIARAEVLTGDFVKSEIDGKVFESALLRLNHEAFIDLFLDKGFEVRLFLTNRRLMRLFVESKNTEFFQSVCLEGALGLSLDGKKQQRGFLVSDLNWLVYQMTNIKNMIRLRDYLYDVRVVSIEPEMARSEERKARNALVVWAVLTNRHKLAKVLWKHSDYPIQLALVISMMYSKLLSYVKEKHVNKQIADLSTEFADMAVGILDMSFKASSCRAFDVLSQEVPEFNWKTVVEIAATAQNRKFIAHACCQKWLTSLFYGEIRIRELKYGFKVPTFLKIFLSAVFLFPAYIWIGFKPTAISNSSGRKTSTVDDASNVDTIFTEESEVSVRSADMVPLYCPAECGTDTHLNIVKLFEPGDRNAQSGGFRSRMHKFFTHAAEALQSWQYIPVLWRAPVTKFWMHQICYIMYLTIFSLAALWHSCGHFILDIVVWSWTLLLLLENCLIIRMRYKGHGLLRLQMSIIESVILAVYLLLFLIARILPSPQFSVIRAGNHVEILSAYQARMITSLGLLYFYYRFVFIYFPISPTLGRLLFRIQLMVTRDFLQFLRLTTLFIVSSGIVIHSAIFPDYPMGYELVRRVFHRSWFTLFSTFITDLEVDKVCSKNITNSTFGDCRLSSYESYLCPVTGVWPYFFNIQFLIILKLILLTLLYALFSDTAAKLASDADAIWRFQRYHLVQNFVARPSVPAPLNCISIPILVIDYVLQLFTRKFKLRKNKFHGDADNPHDAEVNADSLYWRSLAEQYSVEQTHTEKDLPAQQMKKFSEMTVMLEAQNFTMQALNTRISDLELTMTASRLTLENILHSISSEQDSLAIGKINRRSRKSIYPNTRIKRYPVADKFVPWEVLFTVYDPVVYNKRAEEFGPTLAPFVDADNLDDAAITWNSVSGRCSWIETHDGLPVTIVIDSSGAPSNPMGRTGLRGRGNLAKWGPNHCCMLVITKWNEQDDFPKSAKQTKNLSVVTMMSPAGHLHLPVGYANGSMSVYSSVRNVFLPENPGDWTADDMYQYFGSFSQTTDFDFVSIVSDSFIRKMDMQKTKLHRGYLDDDRNTDNAWVEAEVWHFHYPGKKSYQVSGENTLQWRVCSKELMNSMVSNCAEFVKMALDKFQASNI